MVDKATVTGKGQITIPKSVREKMGLDRGQKVVFEIRDDEAVIYPEVSEPHAKLEQLRDEFQFSREELNEMRENADRSWDRVSS